LDKIVVAAIHRRRPPLSSRDEELGWLDGWKGRPPPDKTKDLIYKFSTFVRLSVTKVLGVGEGKSRPSVCDGSFEGWGKGKAGEAAGDKRTVRLRDII
jgi:hypothetical protein